MIQDVVRSQRKLRLAICGASGGGKSYWALSLAAHLGQRICAIDTERGSIGLYHDDEPDHFQFRMIGLGHFNPKNYIEALQDAEKNGCDVVIIDSLSHAWTGKGGVLDIKDQAVKATGGKNEFAGWREATPLHNLLIDAILQSGCHVIATMRSKVDFGLEPSASGMGNRVVKYGMAPVQREGMDYEFDIVCDVDQKSHLLTISKTRMRSIDGQTFEPNGKESPLGSMLATWLAKGSAPAQAPAPYRLGDPLIVRLNELFAECDRRAIFKDGNGNRIPLEAVILTAVAKREVLRLDQLPELEAHAIIRNLERKIEEVSFDPLPDKPEVKEEAAQDVTAFEGKMDAIREESRAEAAQEEAAQGDALGEYLGDVLPQHARPEKADKPEKGKKSKGAKAELAMSAAEAEGRADEAGH